MIEYRNTARPVAGDGFSTMLRETEEFFASQRIQMTGAGFEEIISESTLFEDYKTRLCEGMEASEVEQMEQILENARHHMLREASVSGIQQVAGLSMPTIRKMWAKLAMRHAVPTEPVKQPRFSISYSKAYMIDPDGTKHELPAAINKLDNGLAELPRLDATPVALADMVDAPFDLLAPVSASVALGDSVDKIFKLSSATMEVTLADGTTTEDVVVKVDIKADIHQNLYGVVTGTDSEGAVHTDQIFGKIDFSKGELTVACLKQTIKDVTVDGRLTQEMNNKGQSVSFDIETRDITIGTGAHINAPLPIEWLQDTMAVYNIDGALEVVDLMSQTMAQKLEIEIYNFLVESIDKNDVTYRYAFDVKPSAGFAGSPKEWREELKTVIDHMAIKMKVDTNFSGGKFVLIGNPIDMQLIPNVNWTFSGATDERGGVEVAFNIGAYSGSNRYETVSSDLVPMGRIVMFYIPSTNRQMTYKYYPYTYNVEKGYRDPNFPNVPSIMMTKRHTIEEFTPLIGDIVISGNDGQLPNTSGY